VYRRGVTRPKILAKVGVASSSLVSRSRFKKIGLPSGGPFSLCHGLCQGPQHHGALPAHFFRFLQEQPQPRRGAVPGDVLDLVVQPQQFSGLDHRLADALSERLGSHAVPNGEHARPERGAFGLMALLGRVRCDRPAPRRPRPFRRNRATPAAPRRSRDRHVGPGAASSPSLPPRCCLTRTRPTPQETGSTGKGEAVGGVTELGMDTPAGNATAQRYLGVPYEGGLGDSEPPIERRWAGYRSAKADEHPAPVSTFHSGDRLSLHALAPLQAER
jgi:hypothetical protein